MFSPGQHLGSWLANSPWAIPWQTGRFYSVGLWPIFGVTAMSTLGKGIFFMPIWVPNPVTVASLTLEVSTTGSGTANWYFGIYDSDAYGLPGFLIYGSPVQSANLAAAAAYGPTGLSQALSPGLYWVAFFTDIASGNVRTYNVGVPVLAGEPTSTGSAIQLPMAPADLQLYVTLGLPERADLVARAGAGSLAAGWIDPAPRVLVGV